MSTFRFVAFALLSIVLAFLLPAAVYGLITGNDTVPEWLVTVTVLLVALTIVGAFLAAIDRRRA